MIHTSSRTGRKAAALLAMAGSAALALAAAAPGTAAPGAAAPAARTASGAMTPAVGAQPHHKRVGAAGPKGTVFSCQTTVPASCYGPAQIRAAYGFDKLAANGLDGLGRTIVIVDSYSSPSLVKDLTAFNTLFGLPAADLQQIAPDGLTP